MLDESDVLARIRNLRPDTLHLWIERGWVVPERGRRGYRFREIDLARVRLIHEFRQDLALTDEAVAVVLPLLDQVHGLRHQLHRLADAVGAEPAAVRKRIAGRLAGPRG